MKTQEKTFLQLRSEIETSYGVINTHKCTIKSNVIATIERVITMLENDKSIQVLKPRKKVTLVKSRIVNELDKNSKTYKNLSQAIKIAFIIIDRHVHEMKNFSHLFNFELTKIIQILEYATKAEIAEICIKNLEITEINIILANYKKSVSRNVKIFDTTQKQIKK